MKQEFFTNLPSEIIVDILSRLPVRTIISCKCVCKPWLNLLETDEFVKSHLSKSVPGVALDGPESCKIFEVEDGLDLEHLELHCVPVTEYNSTYYGVIKGSINGLLFYYHQSQHSDQPDGLCIVNPITRECIQIPCPQEFACDIDRHGYGFGVSRITGQHKLIRIFHDTGTPEMSTPSSECEVYTLGSGLWRSITPGPMLEYNFLYFGAFLNGNLHWLVFDSNRSCFLILCFDLEDELFSIFPSPPAPLFSISELGPAEFYQTGLSALEDCLFLNDCSFDDEIVIWVMKEYGVETSWVKEHVIGISQFKNSAFYEIVWPLKVFEDGDILVGWDQLSVIYYSRKTNTAHLIHICEGDSDVQWISYTSSFLSLKSFVNENVISF